MHTVEGLKMNYAQNTHKKMCWKKRYSEYKFKNWKLFIIFRTEEEVPQNVGLVMPRKESEKKVSPARTSLWLFRYACRLHEDHTRQIATDGECFYFYSLAYMLLDITAPESASILRTSWYRAKNSQNFNFHAKIFIENPFSCNFSLNLLF